MQEIASLSPLSAHTAPIQNIAKIENLTEFYKNI